MTTAAPTSQPKIEVRRDWLRYYRIAFFFARTFLSFIFWDLIAAHLPFVGSGVREGAPARWRRTAQRFRRLAIRFGGVLIKLGQFLSIRVDVFPPEITSELAGLQDEVPAETLEDIQAVIVGEFGRPVEQVFAWFAPQPVAAASLAQVHPARLLDPSGATGGTEVVVKVQRPHIERLVETDLAAIRLAATWLKWYRPVTHYVDLDRLYEEFAVTTRRELDFVNEGKNYERFAGDFAGDSRVYIAQVYWDTTTRRVLTLENVAGIKINDFAAIEAAGISRAQVARQLYDVYLQQIFVNHFVHADPHPGNLFLRPDPTDSQAARIASRPFKVVFVDFGMVAVIPEALRAGLREYVIALATHDAHRMVQSYVSAGVLLPDADLKRLEEVHDILLKRMGGVRMGQLRDVALEQADFMFREYRDLIYEMPFQFPSDMLFAMRAVAILSGLATSLDPDFDPWAATIPFAEQLAADELVHDWRGNLDQLLDIGRLLFRLPNRLDRFLTQAERGDVMIQTSLAPDHAKALRRIERSVDRQMWAIVAAGLVIAGALLRSSPDHSTLSTTLLAGAGLAFLVGLTRR
jgi:predicted unusual protein kinase regulating ubiquinone biosynthesis (AarF/ABC1/UbiB family)